MSERTKPFPFRPLLAGELRGKSPADVLTLCGDPNETKDDIWVWMMRRDTPANGLGDPRSVEVQLWFSDDCVEHAWLRLVFADGVDYQEILH